MSLMKKLASVFVTASLVFGLVGNAFAAPAPDKVAAAANRLHALGIVNGSDTTHPDDLQLDQQITRAQLMKIMVWAFGQKENASILKGAQAFPDTANHWASGEIAIAKNIIVEKNHATMGMPDGSFDPEGKVTNAQAVAFLMKFIGINRDASKIWPYDYLDAAVAAGMLSTSDVESISPIANSPASRGIVFYLADVAFASYNMANGKTVYTTYVKPNGPALNVDTPVANTTDKSITLNGSVGTDVVSLTVNGTAITPAADGRFTANVALNVGSNTITVVATDIVKGSTTKTFTVARTVGTAAKVDVSPATVTVAAGESVNFSATVADKDGNALTAAVADVTSDVGTYANGRFTAGTTAKTGTITVKYGNLSPVTVQVTVNPGALNRLVVSPATVDLSAGTSQTFTVSGTDAYGNTVATPASVTWSATKGVMSPNGTFGATADASGTVTVTARAGNVSGTASVTVFGSGTKVQLATPSEMVADGKSETTVTATVLDAVGNVARSYNGQVTFNSTNTSVAKIETATVQAVNGVATTTLAATGKAGTTVLSASASGMTASTVNYTTATQKLTSIGFEAVPGTIGASTSSYGNLKFTLQDQNGNKLSKMPSGVSSVKVKVTTGDAKIVTLSGLSSREFSITQPQQTFEQALKGTAKVGGVTLSADVTAPSSLTGIAVSSTSVSTLTIGDAYSIAVDAIDSVKASGTSEITFHVVDFNGNQLTTSRGDTNDAAVTIYKGDTKITDAGIDVSVKNAEYGFGTATIDWSGYKPSSGSAGEYTIKVKAGTLNAGEATATVTPADASKITLSASPRTIRANGHATTTLTAKVKDDWNNLVTDGSHVITITRATSTKVTDAPAEQTVTTSGGEASVVLTATTKTGIDRFVASSDDLDEGETTITGAILGSAHELVIIDGDGDYDTWDENYAATAGEDVTISVAVADDDGIPLTDDNGTSVTLEVYSGSTLIDSFSGTTEDGFADIDVNVTKASASGLKLVATASGLTKAERSRALVVAPAAPDHLVLSSDVDVLAANGNHAQITITLKDEFDNTAEASDDTTVYVKTDNEGAKHGHLEGTAIADGHDWENYIPVEIADGDSSATIDFISNRTEGSVGVYAVNDDLDEGSVSFSTKISGSEDGIEALAVEDAAVSATTLSGGKYTAGEFQEVSVNVVDGAGVRLTSDNATHITIAVTRNDVTVSSSDVKIAVKNADGDWVPYVAGTNNRVTKGQISFGIASKIADTLEYAFADADHLSGGKPEFKDDGEGTFLAGDAHHVKLVASEPFQVLGNGITPVGVTAQVVDEFGNKVDSFDGTMSFKLVHGSDYASLQDTTATITDGSATVIAKAKDVTNDGEVYVKAGTDIDDDGAIDWTDSDGFLVFNVVTENNAPEVSDFVYDAGARTITVTFDESTNGPAFTPVAGKIDTYFDLGTGETLGVGATAVWDDSDADHTDDVLTITLGDDAIVSDLYFAGDVEVKDDHGNVFDVTDALGSVDADEIVPPTVSEFAYNPATRKITVLFSESTTHPSLTAASFELAAGESFGTVASFVWGTTENTNDTLTITVGSDATLTNIKLKAGVVLKDLAGNAYDVAVKLGTVAVHESVAPTVSSFTPAGRTITVKFSEATNGPAFTPVAGKIDTYFALGAGETFGTGATAVWSKTTADNDTLTITVGDDATLTNIQFAADVVVEDAAHNAYAVATKLGTVAIHEIVAPTVSSFTPAGRTVTVVFSEATNGPAFPRVAGKIDSYFVLGAGETFGTGATAVWSQTTVANDTLTITVGDDATLTNIQFAADVVVEDANHNAYNVATKLGTVAIHEIVAPTVSSFVYDAVGGTITMVFSETTNEPVFTPDGGGLIDSYFVVDAGNAETLGAGATAVWSDGTHVKDTLTITLGTGVKLPASLQFAVGVNLTDALGNVFNNSQALGTTVTP